MSLRNKVLFITGASRGIGEAIALRAARDGAKIAVVAKTTEPHPTLPGTIYTAVDKIKKAGGQAIAIQCDIRFEDQVVAAFKKTFDAFGGIDIVVNNASAINLKGTEETSVSRYDLMNGINARGTWMVSKFAIPYLKNAQNPHILNLAPPLSMETKWFAPHTAYTMAKYGMSMCVLGMSGELSNYGIAVNALWPYTMISTAALVIAASESPDIRARTPEIISDAAHIILTSDSKKNTGNFYLDELFLRENGVKDFDKYSVVPGTKLEDLSLDFFLDSAQVQKLFKLRQNSKL
ncbi:Hydroxysteroid dehydrogenase-like protein 2 [Smittium mucronatum]|uniref:Hydroxysteroid dehydrogenase-like protein 2 n=1 Tax=Smittium mucronatum TaxID=133383 RepID=A0A1R0H7V0_9FUNG|nr:Hydroxysteroid dehydrogenase-like protein 2 [Smittium mucronatum]